MVLRYLSILMLLPLLNKTGYKISLKEIFVLSYGGLRGAVTLSLGMIVAVDEELDKRNRDLCLFLAVSTITFATCINGVSIFKVMQFAGFFDAVEGEKEITKNYLRRLVIKTLRYKLRLMGEN